MNTAKFIKDNKYLIVLTVLLLIGIKLMKGITSIPKILGFGQPDAQETNEESIKKDLKSSASNYMTPKIKQYAEDIYALIRGFSSRSDKQKVVDIIDKLTSVGEISALYLAYGERPKYDNWQLFGYAKMNLVTSLKDEMRESEPDLWQKVEVKLKMAGLT